MKTPLSRRRFLRNSALASAGLAGLGAAAPVLPDEAPAAQPQGASEKLRVAVMGTNGRGTDLAAGFAALAGAEVAYVCDVDSRAVEKAARAVEMRQQRKPEGAGDFRRALDDRSVDALAIAAPDHWHAPATILACAASKHVYVEKPCSHNAREGELMVEAARKHGRVVQHGTQRRSWPGVVEGIEKLRAGAIGRVLFSRGWYNNTRPSIGRGKAAEVPAWLDWSLWQGPAPERPFHDNVVHYNWHWFWHWGTGELGNNGVHALDLCRWGLGAEYPLRVTAGGGKYFFDDDQETPDTHIVTFHFGGADDRGGAGIVWEGRNWHPRGFEGTQFGAEFYGEGGTLVLTGGGYTVFDREGKETCKGTGPGGDAEHFQDFLDSIRCDKRPRADIEEAHKTTLLCHLGNIALRTGRSLTLDPTTHRPVGDEAATALWGREYREGWEPKV
jgi:predicted dehydrogenase